MKPTSLTLLEREWYSRDRQARPAPDGPRPLRVLFVAPYVPSRIRVRPFQLLRQLAARGHRVTLVCPTQGESDMRDLELLRPVCEQVISVAVTPAGTAANYLRALPTRIPLQAAHRLSAPLTAAIRAALSRRAYDVVHLEHLRAAELGLRAVAGVADAPPLVLDSVDSISLLFERALRANPSLKTRGLALLDLARTRSYEAAYSARFQHVLVTSPEDHWALETLRRHFGQPESCQMTVVPNGVDLDYFAPQDAPREPATLVFSGKMSYHANHAAATMLLRRVMPLVWSRRPDVRVQIVGAGPAPALLSYSADPRVAVTGFVPDLRPYLARASIAVCPLSYGVGIQNKVLEAMAMATPVIATRQTTVALRALAGEDLLVAGDPPGFAEAILELLEQPVRRLSIGASGRRYVEAQHDWGFSAHLLERCYAAAARRGQGQ